MRVGGLKGKPTEKYSTIIIGYFCELALRTSSQKI